MEMAFRKRKKKKLKNYQPLFYILLIKGGGNESLHWHEKKGRCFLSCLVVTHLKCMPNNRKKRNL
jgi:hypothetical protein